MTLQHLFVYGTLAPGRPNEHVLADLAGSWQPARVKGTLHPEGWGATMGYPAIVPDEAGEPVEGFVFSSEELEAHWARLDEFEGEAYARVRVEATLADGRTLEAWVYVLAARP